MNIQKIEELNREFERLNNKSLDWLIVSWSKNDAEKELCFSKYKEYGKKCKKVAEEMLKYV